MVGLQALDELRLAFGVVARAHQRPALDVHDAAGEGVLAELGELVDTIRHDDGSGDIYWNMTTSAGQVVASGVYIAVITNDDTGDRVMRKFVIIR